MQSKLLQSWYEPGISLIAGTKKGYAVEVDGVIIHTAYCFSHQVSLLETAKIVDTIPAIYLCGHGNLAEQTIGGRKMAEIAYLLIKAGYRGKQPIHLISCWATKRYAGTTMAELLEEELRKRIPRVLSDAPGLTVIRKNGEGSAENWLLSCEEAELEFLVEYQAQFVKNRYTYLIQHSDQLTACFQNSSAAVTQYKEKLLRGEIGHPPT